MTLGSFHATVQVRDRQIGLGYPPFVIAEMACAHDGKLAKAESLIDGAIAAGVDAIQLQLFTTTHQVAPTHPLHPLLETLAFAPEDWERLFARVHHSHTPLFAFVYDPPSLELALRLGIDGIKLSSADLSNPEMTSAAARCGLPITLGTGASTLDEISSALDTIQTHEGHQVVLMHGVQNFPTAIADANLRRIQLLQRVFQLPVGYQDHTEADLDFSKSIDLVAIGLGACVIEKHITLDRQDQGTDYQAALEPEELKPFVRQIRAATEALGTDTVRPLTESDRRYRQFQKKSICAARAIAKGDTIHRNDLVFLRTETSPGLSPSELDRFLGRIANQDIAAYKQLDPAWVNDA